MGNLDVKEEKEYEQYVKSVTPTIPLARNVFCAFVSGGAICLASQLLLDYFLYLGLEKEAASKLLLIALVGISALLTGLGLYSKMAKFAGAGTLVPITGFANSVAASAIEFKREGQVFGIGTRIFIIAGPVILFGVVASWAAGVVYWILGV